jgi:hypothetical protein
MATTTTTNTKTPNYTKGYPAKSRGSIADLRIYQLALTLEENVFELAKDLRANQFDLANDLRRTSAGDGVSPCRPYRSRSCHQAPRNPPDIRHRIRKQPH